MATKTTRAIVLVRACNLHTPKIMASYFEYFGFLITLQSVLSRSRHTITAEWEKSDDGKKWERDFLLEIREAMISDGL
jgi:hypothetical protein